LASVGVLDGSDKGVISPSGELDIGVPVDGIPDDGMLDEGIPEDGVDENGLVLALSDGVGVFLFH
jgi:hypothetical protein